MTLRRAPLSKLLRISLLTPAGRPFSVARRDERGSRADIAPLACRALAGRSNFGGLRSNLYVRAPRSDGTRGDLPHASPR
jgi:hypothetical protein